jgi:membrane protein
VNATVALWLLGAALFGWYLGNLADYSAIYGSLGGVAITLVFFYYMAVIFLFGAELNAVWREATGRRDAPQAGNGEGEDTEADPQAHAIGRKDKPRLQDTH